MARKKEFKVLKQELSNSRTEEDILKYLIQIVKAFGVREYREVFLNPYYKSLVPDIKKEVLKEISFLRESLSNEVDAIDIELKKVDNDNLEKLKDLKRDCLSLIYEIDEKQKDIENL